MADNFKPPIIKWSNGPKKVTAAVEAEMKKRIAMAAEVVKSQVVKNLSTPTRSAGPSKPGEFPHADTGMGRRSIYWAWKTGAKLVAKVGTPLDYMLRHEVDTGRSFLRRTLFEMMGKVKAILTKPLNNSPPK